MQNCTKNIVRLMQLCRDLLVCADRGDIQRKDESCGVLFGMVRDSAYKMLDLAGRERRSHVAKGTWDMDDDDNAPGVERNRMPTGDGN